MKTKTETPKRKHRVIHVYVLPEEFDGIAKNAEAARLDLSVFLRRVGQGYPVISVIDRNQIAEMSKVNADLGRLGGLLKLWLTDAELRKGMEMPIRQVLSKIEISMDGLRNALERV
jgi:hypothetical protein